MPWCAPQSTDKINFNPYPTDRSAEVLAMAGERFYLELEPPEERLRHAPHVVIVGGGFASHTPA